MKLPKQLRAHPAYVASLEKVDYDYLQQTETNLSWLFDALRGQLAFGQNIRGGSFTNIAFSTPSNWIADAPALPIYLQVAANVTPTGVIVVNCRHAADQSPVTTAVQANGLAFRRNVVQVTYLTGLADSTDYVADFLVI